ncbi:MAG: pca operon transcription factor PcaQ [Rhizobiales bacterium]|jgi:LysR family pca operon transcriptional activator|nr:pca operon transcription factor PcaQ [Hyphomicrobiales bacterium]MBN9010137.1 pca operon transcription factor PcaQ [Hyphomicrobiales bacterium]
MLDPRIKLRHINAFLETVRLGGVARAGGALGMTQPAVSRALAELEEFLGIPLFDRSRRSLVLTAAGEMFARFAQAGLATLQQGVDALEAVRSGQQVVAFGTLPTAEVRIVPEALKRFARGPLASRTRIESGPSPYLLGLLRMAAIDFVVGRLASPEAMDGLSFEHLYSEHLALVVRPGHPLAGRVTLTLAEAAAYPLLMPPRGAIIRPALDALLIAGGVGRLAGEVESVSNSFGRAYTLISDVVWAISESVVGGDLASGALHRLPVDSRATLGPIGITTRTGVDLPPTTLELIACVRAAAANAGPDS